MIRAAGGLLWRRRVDAAIEVCLVHRPRYDDWSLPKGKLNAGEHPLLTAYREVREETGATPKVGPRLPTAHYDTSRGAKTVHYWAMAITAGAGRFAPSNEVDRIRWLKVDDARRQLTYAHDRQLLDDLPVVAEMDALVLLVRHASAGDPDQWDADDRSRPLDAKGLRQAQLIRRVLPLFAPSRMISVANRRCVDTLAPLAADLQLPVETDLSLSEENYAQYPRAAVRRVRDLATATAVTAVCSQGIVIPAVVAALAEADGVGSEGDAKAKKGSVWALFFTRRRLAAADYYPNF